MIQTVNNFLSENNLVRTFLVLLFSVFAGYTLQPMPSTLNSLFMESQGFKMFVLVMLGVLVSLPLTREKLINVLIASLLVLVLFETLRRN